MIGRSTQTHRARRVSSRVHSTPRRLGLEQLEERYLLALNTTAFDMITDANGALTGFRATLVNTGPDSVFVNWLFSLPDPIVFVRTTQQPAGFNDCEWFASGAAGGSFRCIADSLAPGTYQVAFEAIAGQDQEVFIDVNPWDKPGGLVYVRASSGNGGGGNGLNCTGDVDGDGLCNAWEARGIDVDGDGTPELTLPDANPNRKDLYVEYDYMDCAIGGCVTGDTHDHKPFSESIRNVIRAFAAAPVTNPDGSTGINLHVIEGEAIQERETILFDTRGPISNDDFDDIKLGSNSTVLPGQQCGTRDNDGHFGSMADRMAMNCANILAARRQVFRYAVFGHNYSELIGSSGRAETGGNDFMVTLGYDFRDIRRQQGVEEGTFMHEFGHTLNLQHGGGDEINCKPNYLSVMSYTFQFPEIDPRRPLTYSHRALRDLNETNLDETVGLDAPGADYWGFKNTESGTLGSPYLAAGKWLSNSLALGMLDWNFDGGYQNSLAGDINRIDLWGRGCGASPGQTLQSYDDWANIAYNFRTFTTNFADGARVPDTDEVLTLQEVVAIAESLDYDGDSASNAGDNCPAIFNPDQADSDGDGTGDVCAAPPQNHDLGVTRMAESADPVIVDGKLTYFVTVSNLGLNDTGLGDVTGVFLTDVLPDGVTFISATPTQGSCSESSRTVTCNLGTLQGAPDGSASAAGGTSEASVMIVVDVPSQAGSLTNSASVTANEADPNPANDSATTTTDVTLAADLSIAMSASPDQVTIGEDVTYTLTISNDGPADATGIRFKDYLPPGATLVSADFPAGIDCVPDPAADTIICTGGNLSSGASVMGSFVVGLTEAATYTNLATVSANEFDPDEANNQATVQTTVTTPPGVEICDGVDNDGDGFIDEDGVCPVVDQIPPTITNLQLVPVGRKIARVVLTFSEDVVNPLVAANYSLVSVKKNGQTKTAPLSSLGTATYSSVDHVLTFTPAKAIAAKKLSTLRLTVLGSGTLADLFGNSLDGNVNGTTGGDCITRVDSQTNPCAGLSSAIQSATDELLLSQETPHGLRLQELIDGFLRRGRRRV